MEKHVLVCVTHDGRVSSSSYDSLYAAQQAKSIATTGMTLEQVEAERQTRERMRKEWAASHPWRKPETASEHSMLTSGASGISGPSGSWSLDRANGLVREGYPGDSYFRAINGHEIRTAVIFKDVGDNADALNAA